ncbi:hypothetical protein HC031_16270 [Planosporangium thailandense]|uniref:Uncharacterized protein n=1 Tax=Planosporangium thailandense TaxID=765197 RepID=A0ABX0XYY7_9ACTN|nr:hypothetical protein [Planosporangium thailandense]NJC71256.1 hypothetical protein [Planosporangium thailandense]
MDETGETNETAETGETNETAETLARRLGRVLVERAAPAEAVMFGPVSRAFLRDPDRASATRQRSAAGPLGFDDAGETVELLTPALLKASVEVTTYLAEQHVTGATDGDVLAALTVAQRARVREIVERALRREGIAAERAALLADAVVGGDRQAEE